MVVWTAKYMNHLTDLNSENGCSTLILVWNLWKIDKGAIENLARYENLLLSYRTIWENRLEDKNNNGWWNHNIETFWPLIPYQRIYY